MVEVNSDLRTAYIKAEIQASVETDRDFHFYYEAFGYNEHNLRGRMILDVGAGNSEFAEKARWFGARVIRLDPKYSDCEKETRDARNVVVGVAQGLPFRDNVFDETIASYSLYWILSYREEALSEMIRVTKPGGVIKIHPADPVRALTHPKALKESFPDLRIFLGSVVPTLFIEKNPTHSLKDWKRLIPDILPFIKQDAPPDWTISLLHALKDVRLAQAKNAC